MDVNEADELVKAYGHAQARWAVLCDGCARSNLTREIWLPLVQGAERDRNEAAADLRRALPSAR